MKKCLSLMLALVMVFGLAACGAKPAETQPATDAPSVQPVTEAPTQAPTEPPAQTGMMVDTCILKEADDKMLNTYTLLAVDPQAPFTDADGNAVSDVAVNTAGADALIRWFLSQEALDLAGNYGFEEYGEYLFYVKDGAPVYTGEIAHATEETKVIRLSTTTSVKDSGLLGYLLPVFESAYGYTVEVQSAGTGKAISAAKFGNADLILVHAKSQEEAFVEDGFARVVEGFQSERIPSCITILSCADLLPIRPGSRMRIPFWMPSQPLPMGNIPLSPVVTVPAPTPRSCPCGRRRWASPRSLLPSPIIPSGMFLPMQAWAPAL